MFKILLPFGVLHPTTIPVTQKITATKNNKVKDSASDWLLPVSESSDPARENPPNTTPYSRWSGGSRWPSHSASWHSLHTTLFTRSFERSPSEFWKVLEGNPTGCLSIDLCVKLNFFAVTLQLLTAISVLHSNKFLATDHFLCDIGSLLDAGSASARALRTDAVADERTRTAAG